MNSCLVSQSLCVFLKKVSSADSCACREAFPLLLPPRLCQISRHMLQPVLFPSAPLLLISLHTQSPSLCTTCSAPLPFSRVPAVRPAVRRTVLRGGKDQYWSLIEALTSPICLCESIKCSSYRLKSCIPSEAAVHPGDALPL